MTNDIDLHNMGFIGTMREPPEGWEQATLVDCESVHRACLAGTSHQDDQIFFQVHVRGDRYDMRLEVQCLAWAHRSRKRFVYITGVLTRDGESVPYWASIDLDRRTGNLCLSPENFKKIGFAKGPLSAF